MSLRLHLLSAALRLTVKPALSGAGSPELLRRATEFGARRLPHAPPHSCWRDEGGMWVSSGRVAPRGVILHFHGGGYVAGSPATHRRMLARLSRLSGLRVYAPNYPLAPEHPAPAAFDAGSRAWQALVARGYRPQDIALGGDSAGGGLALALLARLCGLGAQPFAAYAFSPWTDLTLSGASLTSNARLDPMLPAHRNAFLRDTALGDLAPDDPRVSPLFAQFPGCPPVLIQVSSTEILNDDAGRMVARLQAEGSDSVLQTWPGAPHVWQIFAGWIPEAQEALQSTAEFLRSRFPGHPPTDS